eukprot:XP_001692420.1 predicted protein [Chlamydomonas reinhardtii]
MGLSEVLAALQTKPAKRESHELQTLATYFRRQPFFAGVDFTTLQQICSIITLQRASPGEVLLHSGELTDRMYLLLSGRCTIVRHSKKEGYVAPPPQTLRRGQALAEAALPICGAARTAVLNCCARSLAAAEPERRTMEQSDDLGAVLRQLPGMAGTPPPVLRALSEAAALRRLPAGTILYEEHTRAESQFVVRCRQQKLGQSRAAIRSAMRAVVLRRNQSSREAALESVKLTREGLRDPEPAKPVAHGEKSKKFMMEFISRAKQTLNTNDAAPIFSTPSAVAPEALSEGPTTVAPPASPGEPLAPTTPTSSLAPSAPSTAPPSRAASAWHRAALKLTHSGEEGSQGGAGPQLVGAGEGDDYDESDPMLLEYQRRKAEEAGLVSDVGNLLGGAGARSAHLRGIAAARSGKAHFYDHSEEERDEDKDGKHGFVDAVEKLVRLAVRSDLVAERLAVLGALEPLRGLSEEHQAAVALGAAVISVDSNALVVQQGQTVDALYVVLARREALLARRGQIKGTPANMVASLGQVTEDAALQELAGADGGPGRGALPAAMQQAARPGASQRSLGLSGASNKRMSISGLSTYGNSSFGAAPAGASSGGGAIPSVSAAGTDGPNTRTSVSGGGFLHRLESRGRGGDMGGRPALLTVESFVEGGAGGGSSTESPRGTGPPPGIAGGPFGAPAPSPIPSHLSTAGVRQGISSTPLPYINTAAGTGLYGYGMGGSPASGGGSGGMRPMRNSYTGSPITVSVSPAYGAGTPASPAGFSSVAGGSIFAAIAATVDAPRGPRARRRARAASWARRLCV